MDFDFDAWFARLERGLDNLMARRAAVPSPAIDTTDGVVGPAPASSSTAKLVAAAVVATGVLKANSEVPTPARHSLDQGTSAPDLAPTPAMLTPTMKAATSCIPMSPTRCSMGGLDHNTNMDDPMAACLLPGSAPTPSPRPWLEPVPPRPPDPTLQHDDYATRISAVFAPSVTNTADVNTATAVMNSNISVLGNSVNISSVARANVQCASFEVQFDSETFRLMIFFFNAYIYSSNKCLPTTLVAAPIVSEPETVFLVELELPQAGYVMFCGQFRDIFVAALLKNLLSFHSMIDVAENITLLRLVHPATRPWSELFGNMYLSESGNLLYNKQTDLAPSDSQVSVVELELSACGLEVEVTHGDNLLRGQVSFAPTILSFAWANLICFPNSEMCALLAGILLLKGARIKSEMSNKDIRTHAADFSENKIPYLGRCLGMPLSVIEVSRHVLALGDAYTAEFNANTPDRVALFMTEVPVIIDPELWGQSGNTIRLIWSSKLMDLISGNENCAQVLRHGPQLHRDSGKNKRSHVPWDPGGSPWCRWFSPCYDQEPSQGGRDFIAVTAFSEQIHVSHDCYNAFINYTPVDSSYYYLDQAYYFDKVGTDLIYYRENNRGDSSMTKEAHMPWDPGKSVLQYHWKLRLGDKPNFKEGGMLGAWPVYPMLGCYDGLASMGRTQPLAHGYLFTAGGNERIIP